MWEFSGRLTRLIKINSNLNGSSAIRFGISNLPFEVFQFLHSTLPSKWQSDYFSSLAFGYLSFFTFIYHRSKAARIFASRRCDAKKKKKRNELPLVYHYKFRWQLISYDWRDEVVELRRWRLPRLRFFQLFSDAATMRRREI